MFDNANNFGMEVDDNYHKVMHNERMGYLYNQITDNAFMAIKVNFVI